MSIFCVNDIAQYSNTGLKETRKKKQIQKSKYKKSNKYKEQQQYNQQLTIIRCYLPKTRR